MPPIRRLLLTVTATAAALVLAGVAAGAVIVLGGFYDVAATRQHWQFTFTVLQSAKRHAIERRARDIPVPSLADEAMALRGAACFRDQCVQCHGAPGVPPGEPGRSMQPLPPPLVQAGRQWPARELYWVTRHGLRMTGMPAWEFRLQDGELWELVAFMQRLPQLDPALYQEWMGRAPPAPACGPGARKPPERPVVIGPVPPDLDRGRTALYQHACNACHTIPGVTGAKVFVGPPLEGIASRQFIAGTLLNTPANMALWLMQTRQVKPGTAMPQLEVDERDARDMAGYLATLR